MLASGLASAVMLGAAGIGIVGAQSSTGQNSLVKKIAQKFNLKEADVQQVFDQNHQDMQAQREANGKTRLDQAVKDGKITQAQEDLIVAKHKEMQTFMDGLKDKTEAERHTAMETKMTELKKWATDNGISQEFMGPGGRGGRGYMGRMMDGPRDADDGTPPASSSTN